MVEASESLGAEPVQLYGAFAQPSGTIEARAYARLGRNSSALADQGPFDALALALHGAAVAADIDDVETDLVRGVREVVGTDVPIVGSFDLHGNITQEMADLFDVADRP